MNSENGLAGNSRSFANVVYWFSRTILESVLVAEKKFDTKEISKELAKSEEG